MIQAWFQTSGGAIVPAHVPDAEVAELACAAGMSAADLFSIELPSGASREGRVKVIVEQAALATLYASGANANATFYWQEADNVTAASIAVWLLPPKPVFMVAGGNGVALVEAVDVRYWWRQTQINSLNSDALAAPLFSSDGRWNTAGYASTTTPRNFVLAIQSLVASVAGTFVVPVGYAPDVSLMSRLADHVFTPECSLAMALDFVLAATGWMLQYDLASSTYVLVEIGDDSTTLGTWMASHKRAIAGGTEATSNVPSSTEPLMSLWQSNADFQRNRMPSQVTLSYPYRSVEGKTKYDNTSDFQSGDVRFPDQREFGWQQTLATPRARTNIGARVLKEPRPLVASTNTALDATNPTLNIDGTTTPSWNYATYNTQVMALLVKRCAVIVGKTAWGGWPALPLGAYRCTMLRYTLSIRNDQVIPVCMTDAQQDDWILGPSGITPNDPTQIAFGKGLAHARRLSSGALQIDVAPPNCRVFPARITASAVAGCPSEDPEVTNPWIWVYSFEEVEPNPCPDSVCPIWQAGGAFKRSGVLNARNLTEAGNVYYASNDPGNVIAPGVLQSDYPTSTVSALTIRAGTIVQMVEQFPTLYTGGEGCATQPPYATQYWFAMPNAVKVTCNASAYENITLDGGTYVGGT